MIIELVLGPSHSRFGVMARDSEAFEVRPFPKIRRAYVDVLREGHRRHIIHGLVEVDVTRARSTIRDQPVEEDDDRLSFTGFLVACVGRAVDEDRMLHAHRWGRRKLILFDEVDVNLQLEQLDHGGNRIVQSRSIRAANHKTVEEISDDIREAQQIGDADRRRLQGTLWFLTLPVLIRSVIWRAVMKRPWWTKRFGGTGAVSSVGMFGIGVRPVLVDGAMVNR